MKHAFFKRFSLAICSVVLVSFFAAASVFALTTESYNEGLAFGKAYKAEIINNIAQLKAESQKTQVGFEQALRYAKETEQLYNSILPQKVEWMQGLADGSGIPYEDILVFNTVDKMLTGFVGECTTFIANGKALASGSGSVIAKNRDVGLHTLSEIGLHQAATHPKDSLYKAAYIDIPEVEQTYKFIGSRSAGRWGYGMGINEYQVSVSDNDAPSRDELGFTASLHDNDLIRLVLERAKTAREGVDIVAGLVSQFGQAWNGIMFEIGDPNELWVVEVTGKRWVAKQYNDTAVARSNQYQIEDDYDLAAPDLVSFAVSQGWVPEGTERINFKQVYSTDELYPEDNDLSKRNNQESIYQANMRYLRATELLEANMGNLTPELMISMTRDHYDTYKLPSGTVVELNQVPFYSSDLADWYLREWNTVEPANDLTPVHMYIRGICAHDLGWGGTSATAVLISRPDVPNELGLMLHAFMPPCNSTFIPFYVGITNVDNRYKGPEAAAAFNTIATRAFAGYTKYHAAIRKAFDPYEADLFKELPAVEKKFQELKNSKNPEDAVSMLTQFVKDKSVEALNLVSVAHDYMTQAAKDATSWSR